MFLNLNIQYLWPLVVLGRICVSYWFSLISRQLALHLLWNRGIALF